MRAIAETSAFIHISKCETFKTLHDFLEKNGGSGDFASLWVQEQNSNEWLEAVREDDYNKLK
jgi:hypothetical protein